MSAAYFSLSDTARVNARRHLLRARAHADDGRLDYAAGSLRKAARWYCCAKRLRGSPRGAQAAWFVSALVRQMDAAFLTGASA